ncbi:MAG: hypothetical protein HKN07_09345 [Acidimicrobiia bacterium]|nr:hypothetical protein [Acidimicrobiia bacterium]
MATFTNRADAGRQLAARLTQLSDQPVVVLGLPRGGVVVAAQVAKALDASLDVLVVRKLGVPRHEELAFGAIGESNSRVLNPEVIHSANLTADDLREVEARERAELIRRVSAFRGSQEPVDLAGTVALIVDDGIATGATAKVACEIARQQGASRIVLAVPIAPHGWETDFGSAADEYVAVITSRNLGAIGQWYDDFTQTSDEEVVALLEK